jgi:hypothetical protein
MGMKDKNQSKSTGPTSKKGKAIASRNAITHGLTGNQVLPDEVQMVDDFVKELTAYYKPQSPLEVLQIQRIAFCRAKLAKLMDIEVAGREIFRREIESNPALIFEKLNQYSPHLKHLATLELEDQSILKVLGLDKTSLQSIEREIREFAGGLENGDDLPKVFPKLCGFLKKSKFVDAQATDMGWDQRLMIFAEKIRILTIGSDDKYAKVKPGTYEAALLKINKEDQLVATARRKQERQFQPGTDNYLRVIQSDFNVITDLARSFAQVKAVLSSYEEMKSWMLRSVDLSAQESERMMRYQTMLEKRLSTAIGELLMLQKIGLKSNFSVE